ncbi:hypothetical protein UCREL1_11725 [Eutypa lata UCREL1]|uniref:Uncharacterized protein n=1 Tax=Eutypa lata (strain UCR-EL1) TaxID=1287681 RepID=M7S5J8_EUTLA|nr:hypothetical protein UCREL1_11725 [Eutypa lata UCREL1]
MRYSNADEKDLLEAIVDHGTLAGATDARPFGEIKNWLPIRTAYLAIARVPRTQAALHQFWCRKYGTLVEALNQLPGDLIEGTTPAEKLTLAIDVLYYPDADAEDDENDDDDDDEDHDGEDGHGAQGAGNEEPEGAEDEASRQRRANLKGYLATLPTAMLAEMQKKAALKIDIITEILKEGPGPI